MYFYSGIKHRSKMFSILSTIQECAYLDKKQDISIQWKNSFYNTFFFFYLMIIASTFHTMPCRLDGIWFHNIYSADTDAELHSCVYLDHAYWRAAGEAVQSRVPLSLVELNTFRCLSHLGVLLGESPSGQSRMRVVIN